MRVCEKNTKTVWVSNDIITVDELDDEGYFTGEVIQQRSSAVKMKLHLSPVTGSIGKHIFGEYLDINLVTVVNGNPFNKNTVIFLNEPNADYSNYDYTIKSIKEGLNETTYGLKKVI